MSLKFLRQKQSDEAASNRRPLLVLLATVRIRAAADRYSSVSLDENGSHGLALRLRMSASHVAPKPFFGSVSGIVILDNRTFTE
jgi:hypothetical protein